MRGERDQVSAEVAAAQILGYRKEDVVKYPELALVFVNQRGD